ncbi:hypothetical protein ABXN37_27200 [Piscinibacter sakaiensis]
MERAQQGLGIDPEKLAAHRIKPAESAAPAPEVMDVWPELWEAFGLFRSCIGQYEVQLGVNGVSYGAARACNVRQHMEWLHIVGLKRQRRVWGLYRMFEHEALKVLNDRAAKAAERANKRRHWHD